ncbi:diguanylate cyclase domain-containing protein [Lacticaseibacillus porcinae]|uniref:bifunctional diguanylate cyclase/phosphodiesterase n=1 Tax=Lacticaseibacillus porcinae TaxID=1123687 RepID=UPI000F79CF81|nr:diguanylate cyclase [Lacticaseibacillus porcinae]
MMDIFTQWFVDAVISVLALAGYITYYNQLLNGDHPYSRIRIDVMIIGVAVGLQLAQWIDPPRMKVYENLQVLVLAFPLLGTDMDRGHLLVRGAGLILFSTLNHATLSWWQFALGMSGQILVIFVMQRYYNTLREHFSLNTLLMCALVSGYWIPRVEFDWPTRIGLILTYLLISSVNFWYWKALRVVDQRYSKLAHQVNFDPLTNAASFALFRQNADRAFTHARKLHQPLVVMMLDIDYFKRINDHYGHPVGDAVLIACLHRLESVLKPHGARIYRTGGEEFTVLLPHLEIAEAENLAIACRQAMRKTPLSVGELQIDVTISMGMADMLAEDPDFDALYARCDADLYRSKARGRDTLTVNGRTLWRHDRLTVSHFFVEYTQSVMTMRDRQPVYAALSARYWVEQAQAWQVADQWHMAIAEALRFLQAASVRTQLRQVALNVTAEQFGDPRLLPQLVAWLAQAPSVDRIQLVVTQTPSVALVAANAERFAQQHIDLALHPTANTEWLGCLPFLSTLIVDMQHDRSDAQQAIADAAKTAGLSLCAYGVETDGLAMQARVLGATSGSGAYFSKPILPQVVARTNRDQVEA